MQGFRSSAACKAIVRLLYRTIFAVHSAFQTKGVSALAHHECVQFECRAFAAAAMRASPPRAIEAEGAPI